MGDRQVVENLIAFNNAAVPMRGVLAEADVRDDTQVRDLTLQCPYGTLYRCIRIGRFGSDRILVIGQPEEQHTWHAVRLGGGGFLDGFVDGELKHAGHRADLAAYAAPFADE